MPAVLLLSGGLDSLVAAYAARAEHSPVLGVTFDYGQRSAAREAETALQVCAELGAIHRLIKLPWLARLAPAALTAAAYDVSAADDPSVWVPARNAVFVSIAAAFAEAMDCNGIVCGFNAEEAEAFPDNSPEFVRRCEAMLELGARNAPTLVCPTLRLKKAEIVRLGLQVGAPLHLVWSCYGAGPAHCWKCPSCRRLRRALEDAGHWDAWQDSRAATGVDAGRGGM
ncbi:MAG: 7-cyano-7-deazaguanine synthase QueC [Armatimonadota bacterium]